MKIKFVIKFYNSRMCDRNKLSGKEFDRDCCNSMICDKLFIKTQTWSFALESIIQSCLWELILILPCCIKWMDPIWLIWGLVCIILVIGLLEKVHKVTNIVSLLSTCSFYFLHFSVLCFVTCCPEQHCEYGRSCYKISG